MFLYDFCIIGGGIVGLATAFEIKKSHPDARIVVLEKEKELGSHQTSHNSGVIHSGIYYEPSSFKAKLCRQGLLDTIKFCRENDIKIDTCGKLIVATTNLETKRLYNLYERSKLNKISAELLDSKDISALEPSITGQMAILCKDTGIVNYQKIALKISELLTGLGVDIVKDFFVSNIFENHRMVIVGNASMTYFAKKLIVCAGLDSDRLAKLSGLEIDCQIIPFRGEFYKLPPKYNSLVNHLIYPVPDPKLPFLGIHITKTISGEVTVGPNAVVALSRSEYTKSSFNSRDIFSMLSFAGFWKMLWTYKDHVVNEGASYISKKRYLDQCHKYCPSLVIDDLKDYTSGVRAQLVSRDGRLLHDFEFAQTRRMLHVLNAPSPAATSALPIGRMIAEKILN